MSSPLYQYVINLAVSLPIKRSPGVIMNVSVFEFCALEKGILLRANVCYFSTIIITILM